MSRLTSHNHRVMLFMDACSGAQRQSRKGGQTLLFRATIYAQSWHATIYAESCRHTLRNNVKQHAAATMVVDRTVSHCLRRLNSILMSRRMVIPHSATACASGSDMKMTKARGCGMRISQLFCRLNVDLQGSHGELHCSLITEKLVATNPEEREGRRR